MKSYPLTEFDAPARYNDSFWLDLASDAEDKYDLPKGSLVSIVKTEASNHGKFTPVTNAYTPFQITEKTRNSIIEKDGYDPFLNAENAARAAAQVYKDGLKKNDGNPILAARYYNAGSGKQSDDNYIKANRYANKFGVMFKKVVSELTPNEAVAAEIPTENESNYELTNDDKLKLQRVYESGEMSDSEAAAFERDFPDLTSDLERGSIAPELTDSEKATLVDAYKSGKMSDEEKASFAADFPDLVGKVVSPTLAGENPAQGQTDGALPYVEGSGGELVMPAIGNMITGGERNTEQVQGFPSFTEAPEFARADWQGIKNTMASTFASPDGIAKMAAKSGMNVTQDNVGNYYMKSSDGNTYAIHPGFSSEDNDGLRFGLQSIPYTVAALATGGASLPMQMGAQALTQTGIEKLKESAGDDPSLANVAIAGATPLAERAIGAALGGNLTTSSPVTKTWKELTNNEQIDLINKFRKGDPEATSVIASLSKNDPDLLESLKRLGVADEMPTGSMTRRDPDTNLSDGQDLWAFGTSEKSSPADVAWQQTVKNTNAKVSDVVSDIGSGLSKGEVIDDITAKLETQYNEAKTAVDDLLSTSIDDANSTLKEFGATDNVDDLMKTNRTVSEESIKASAKETKTDYENILSGIDETSDAGAPNTLKFLQDKLDGKLKGDKSKFTTLERELYERLSPKVKEVPIEKTDAVDFSSGDLKSKKVVEPITYGYLDQEKRRVTALKYSKDPLYADSDSAAREHLESLLTKDQEHFADLAGQGDALREAKSKVGLRKKEEGEVRKLYGKDGTYTKSYQKVKSAIKNAANGDGANLNLLLETLPEESQASSIATSFNLAVKDSEGKIDPEKWIKIYDGLKSNEELFGKVTGVLGEDSSFKLAAMRDKMEEVMNAKNSITSKFSDNITSLIDNAIGNAVKGESSTLNKLLSVVPEENRKDAVVHALQSYLKDKNTGELSFDKFINFYRDLRQTNPKMYGALAKELGEGGHQTLQDIFVFSKHMKELETSISSVRSAEGGLQGDIKKQNDALGAFKSTVSRFLSLMSVKKFGMPLSGSAISGTLTNVFGKNTVIKSEVASVLASPEFKNLVREASKSGVIEPKVVKKLAYSERFSKFMKANGLKDREVFINALSQPAVQNLTNGEN